MGTKARAQCVLDPKSAFGDTFAMRVLALSVVVLGCSAEPVVSPVTSDSSALRARPSVDAPSPRALLPESDSGAIIDPDRDIVLTLANGERQRVTDLPGAEDAEAISPDGKRITFLAGASGLAAVWVADLPAPGEPPRKAIQLTNVGLEKQPRAPGRMPPGFVPPPERGHLRWSDDHTITWEAQGRSWSVVAR